MDLLVLFPLEFLGNFPASKPVLEALRETSGAKKRGPVKSGDLEDEEGSGELDVKAKLRFEFTKIPALLSLKPN